MSHNFLTRTLASLVLIPFVVGIILLPVWARCSVLVGVSMICFYEFIQMARFGVVDKTKGGRRLLAFGFLYLLLSLGALTYLFVTQNAYHLIWFLSVVWATDIFAYVAGRFLGGVKLAPRISPNKTWAGFIGGILGGVMVSELYHIALHVHLTHASLSLVLLICVSVHLGDLAESWAKRMCGVKDSGRLIPGHGGLLDRVDGLLAAALVYACALLISV